MLKIISQNMFVADQPLKLLDFPSVRQATDFSCGAAAFEAILAYYGIKGREDEIREAVDTHPESGTEEENIALFAKKLGFKVLMQPMSFEMVKKFIDHNIPVMILLQAWSEEPVDYQQSTDQGHFAVVIGYGTKGFFFEDPSLFNLGYLTFQELTERWHGDEHDPHGLALAIYGKPPKFHSNKVEHIE